MWTVIGIVPRGFEAYARILHPAWRITGRSDNFIRTPVRWSEIASLRGTTPHRLMQWPQIWALPEFDSQAIDLCVSAGMAPVEGPDEGTLPAAVAGPLKAMLASRTNRFESCWFGVWVGYGCGYKPEIQKTKSIATESREWGLFRAPLEKLDFNFLDAAEEFGNTANLVWPDDRTWCVATEIDHTYTYVGGSGELISDILRSEDLEAYEVFPDDSAWVDTVNPPVAPGRRLRFTASPDRITMRERLASALTTLVARLRGLERGLVLEDPKR